MKIQPELFKQIYEDYMQGVSFKRLEKKYSISSTTLYREIKKIASHNERKAKRYKDYNCEPYLTFREKYLSEQKSIAVIAEECHCSISKVQKYLEKFGLTRNNLLSKKIRSQQNLQNVNFFEKIDTEEKAYWLGFLMADGSLRKNEYACQLSIAKKDIDHLRKFAAIFNLPVYEGSRYDKRTKHVYEWCSAVIPNKYVVNSLQSLGMISNKTYRLDTNLFSNIPDKLKRHFIRGYFDGDGSTTGYKVSFASCSNDFLDKISTYLVDTLLINSPHKYKSGNCYSISWYGKENMQFIYNFFYAYSHVFLDRKRLLMEKCFSLSKRKWTAEENAILSSLNNETIKDKAKISAMFPLRSYDAVYRKFRRRENHCV